MKSEEIVRALRCCEYGGCIRCPLLRYKRHCQESLLNSAAELIERQEKEKAKLLGYAKKSAGCEQCANYRPRCNVIDCFDCVGECPCKNCKHGSKWKWKGVDEK